ncbi:hypothetical protein PY093_05560 [Cytobacillus sp. S13-E01]|uniref:hypothetical protein n=1 Tax=Cytobacillus sp. S13-E01 TaxID=3031326 RepID=UPI0023D7DE6A|nr:hypothetical protein [Cytobacillus sp. S13-E01]MDF0726179.1 hypothetical protein [Cytobacillus sp. S13-E01]
MKKSEWSDEQLEHFLKQMPIVKDNRNPHDIYQSISSKVRRKQKRSWIVPTLATASALFLMVLIGSSFLNQSNSSDLFSNSSQEGNANEARMFITNDAEDKLAENSRAAKSEDRDNFADTQITSMEPTTLESYVIRDFTNKKLFTFGIPDQTVQAVIPISVLIDNTNVSHIDLLPDVVQKVNEKLISSDYGLADFPLSRYSFSEKLNKDESKNIILDFPKEMNAESFASAESFAFWGSLAETFRWFDADYKEIEFYQAGKMGVSIGQSGVESTTYELNKAGKRAYFMYRPFENGRKFLVPYEVQGKSVTFTDALETMKNDLENGTFKLNPTIFKNVNFKIDETDTDNVTITFTEETSLEDNDPFVFMIDAIMLTAKEFGYKSVTFENAKLEKIGTWDLSSKNDVPVAPNPIILD